MTTKERKAINKVCKDMLKCLEEMEVVLDRMEKNSYDPPQIKQGLPKVMIAKPHYA